MSSDNLGTAGMARGQMTKSLKITTSEFPLILKYDNLIQSPPVFPRNTFRHRYLTCSGRAWEPRGFDAGRTRTNHAIYNSFYNLITFL